MTGTCRTGVEHVLGEDAHRARRRPLAHPDEDDAVPDRHHVAALHAGLAPVVAGAPEPDLEVGLPESRVEAVDRFDVERLELASGPEHRVERDAAVEPGGRVAREELVRQRRQDEVRRMQRVADRRAHLRRKLEQRDPARQMRGQVLGGHLCQPLPQRLGEHDGDVLGPDAASKQPFATVGVLHRLCQQLVEEQNLDVPFAHEVDEGVVLLPRAADPDHVVEKELVAVRRRQPLVGEVWTMHHHHPELSDLGVGAQHGLGGSAHLISFLEGLIRRPPRCR